MMQNFDCNKFCEKVITLFGDMGQIELSQKIGISQGVISAIKNKKSKAPGADTIFKIASYFDVSVDWLLGLPTSNKTKSTKSTLDRKIFSTRLKELREENNMSCAALATRIGVTGASLGYYERGERVPDIETTQKICRVFDVTSDYLLGLSDATSTDIKVCEHYIAHEENKLRIQREEIADALEKLALSMRG